MLWFEYELRHYGGVFDLYLLVLGIILTVMVVSAKR